MTSTATARGIAWSQLPRTVVGNRQQYSIHPSQHSALRTTTTNGRCAGIRALRGENPYRLLDLCWGNRLFVRKVVALAEGELILLAIMGIILTAFLLEGAQPLNPR